MVGYFNNFYLGSRRNRAWLETPLEKKQKSLKLGEDGNFRGCIVFLLRHNYDVDLFFSYLGLEESSFDTDNL